MNPIEERMEAFTARSTLIQSFYQFARDAAPH